MPQITMLRDVDESVGRRSRAGGIALPTCPPEDERPVPPTVVVRVDVERMECR